MKTYVGKDFSIAYPANWTASQTTSSGGALQTNGAIFSSADGQTMLTVSSSPNPVPVLGYLSPAQAVNDSVQVIRGTNIKRVPLAPTTSTGGQSWDQAAATADQVGGQTGTIKRVVLATNHPAQGRPTTLFNIQYSALLQLFDQQNTLFFQPMLQSFKFTR